MDEYLHHWRGRCDSDEQGGEDGNTVDQDAGDTSESAKGDGNDDDKHHEHGKRPEERDSDEDEEREKRSLYDTEAKTIDEEY